MVIIFKAADFGYIQDVFIMISVEYDTVVVVMSQNTIMKKNSCRYCKIIEIVSTVS